MLMHMQHVIQHIEASFDTTSIGSLQMPEALHFLNQQFSTQAEYSQYVE